MNHQYPSWDEHLFSVVLLPIGPPFPYIFPSEEQNDSPKRPFHNKSKSRLLQLSLFLLSGDIEMDGSDHTLDIAFYF